MTACQDRAVTRAAATAYLEARHRESMIRYPACSITLEVYVRANLRHLMARPCADFVCDAGHAYWRACPQCGTAYGDHSAPPCGIIGHGPDLDLERHYAAAQVSA